VPALGGSCASLDRLQFRPVDLDPTRLLLLGYNALEIDVKQAVLKLGRLHFDMLGELETALERATGDALIEIPLLGSLFALATDTKNSVTNLDGQILLAKPGHSERHPVVVLVSAFNVVGRIGLGAVTDLVQHVEDVVEADRGTEKGRK